MTIKKRVTFLYIISSGFIFLLILINFYFFNILKKEIYNLELTDTLRTKALQLRRYEKNIFLRFDSSSEEDYKKVLQYMNELEKTINELYKSGYKYKETSQLKKTLLLYKQIFFELENLSKDVDEKIKNSFKSNPELLTLLRSVILSHPSEVADFLKKLKILKDKDEENLTRMEVNLLTLRDLGDKLIRLTKELDILTRTEIEKKLRLLKIIQIVVLGFFTGITLVGILLLTRSIMQRCKILSMLIEDTAKGKFKKYKLFNISDELDLLIYKFTIMEEKLKEREELLEKQREELYQMKKMAALGRLLTKISHEFNNPVNNLFLALKSLEMELSPEEKEKLKEYLEDFNNEIHRLRKTIDRFLIYSKKRPLNKISLSLNELLHKMWDTFKRDYPSQEVYLEINSSEDFVIKGDPVLLESAFINLFKNAYEAMNGKGKITITITSKNEAVHIEIKDTGKGIPEEIQDQIFEPFFSTKPNGIGIGLSLAKEIFQKHGGDLILKETSKEGTTFEIILPL